MSAPGSEKGAAPTPGSEKVTIRIKFGRKNPFEVKLAANERVEALFDVVKNKYKTSDLEAYYDWDEAKAIYNSQIADEPLSVDGLKTNVAEVRDGATLCLLDVGSPLSDYLSAGSPVSFLPNLQPPRLPQGVYIYAPPSDPFSNKPDSPPTAEEVANLLKVAVKDMKETVDAVKASVEEKVDAVKASVEEKVDAVKASVEETVDAGIKGLEVKVDKIRVAQSDTGRITSASDVYDNIAEKLGGWQLVQAKDFFQTTVKVNPAAAAKLFFLEDVSGSLPEVVKSPKATKSQTTASEAPTVASIDEEEEEGDGRPEQGTKEAKEKEPKGTGPKEKNETSAGATTPWPQRKAAVEAAQKLKTASSTGRRAAAASAAATSAASSTTVSPDVQTYMTNNVKNILEHHKSANRAHDTHGTHLRDLKNLKPDLSCSTSTVAKAVLFHTMYGEFKERKKDTHHFVASELGQLANYLLLHMDLLTSRQQIIGFISNGREIQFLKIVRRGEAVEGTRGEDAATERDYLYFQTDVLLLRTPDGKALDEGGILLIKCLLASAAEHHLFTPPNVTSVIGRGYSSTVYLGEGGQHVMKLFHRNHKGLFERERDFFEKVVPLLNTRQSVFRFDKGQAIPIPMKSIKDHHPPPRLECFEDVEVAMEAGVKLSGLLLRPVGEIIKPIDFAFMDQRQIVLDIVSFLYTLHKSAVGFCHCDVRPANVLVTRIAGRDRGLVVDFGFSHPLSQRGPHFAPDRKCCTPGRDLFMLVATVYYWVHGIAIDTSNLSEEKMRFIRDNCKPLWGTAFSKAMDEAHEQVLSTLFAVLDDGAIFKGK